MDVLKTLVNYTKSKKYSSLIRLKNDNLILWIQEGKVFLRNWNITNYFERGKELKLNQFREKLMEIFKEKNGYLILSVYPNSELFNNKCKSLNQLLNVINQYLKTKEIKKLGTL